LNDFTAAAGKNTGIRLWNAHGKINSKYRSRLAKFRDAEGQKRPVERRKLEKHYLDFIKSSMRFYRGYIQRLATHFQSPKEVLEIAHKFRLDSEPLSLPRRSRSRLMVQLLSSILLLSHLNRRRNSFSNHAMQRL
jgi:Telomerase activating protein Est1